MIRYGKETNKNPEKILEYAIAYFGPEGEGLEVAEQDDCHVSLTGGGGFVTVSVCELDDGDGTDVDLTAREWEIQAKDFIAKL